MARIQLKVQFEGAGVSLLDETNFNVVSLREGETIKIGNAMHGWRLEAVDRGTRCQFRRLTMSGRPTDYVTARFADGEEILWATTSGSARRGVAHRVHQDADPIRAALHKLGLPASLVYDVDQINQKVDQGGALC